MGEGAKPRGSSGRPSPGGRLRQAAAAVAVLAASVFAGGGQAAAEGPPERPDTRQVMFVGNNWDGTADIIDVDTYERLARIDTIPDREERMAEITADPERLAFFLAIREAVGEGHDQFTDDMFSTHDGRLVAVSRPSFADVVGISLKTKKIVWRFAMEGQRADHMGVSPDGTRLLVSDSTANKVHELDILTGEKTGEFESGDSPHESNYSGDGKLIFHASIGRVYTPTDRTLGPLSLVRDTSKGDRRLQIVNAETLEIVKQWDIGTKLDEFAVEQGEPRYADMSSAVRPMVVSPDERYAYLQVSFHHGFVEYDLEAEKVLRVADLPISEEAKSIPPEQYLLDSAHHGLGMNAAGTKLCVAGTMSDYAAIVDRASFETNIVSKGTKPYWSTTGADGNRCWVSYSGDDEVVVLDYASERELKRIPVGDHPQRVRPGAIQEAFLAQSSPPADDDSTTDEGSGRGSRRNRGAGSGSGQGQDVAAGDRGGTAGVRTVSDGQLPFTGLELISLALAGLALTGAGWALLRRLRPRAAAGNGE